MMSLHPSGALALRRAAIAVTAVVVTLVAHLLGEGHGFSSLNLAATAMAVGMVGAGAVLVGRRGGRFCPRGPVATVAILAAFQVAAHLVMWTAPWMVGLEMHHQGALITPMMVLMHAAATLVLVPVVAFMERVLAAAVDAAHRLRRLLVRPSHGVAWVDAVPNAVRSWVPVSVEGWLSARGPPLGMPPG